MGADFLFDWVYIEKDKRPDWEAARNSVATWDLSTSPSSMTPMEWMENYGDGEAEVDDDGNVTTDGMAEIRAHALYVVEEMFEILEGTGSREVSGAITIGPYAMWLTGGMSWGDDPTDAMRVFSAFGELPAALAAGFFPRYEPDMRINDRILDRLVGDSKL